MERKEQMQEIAETLTTMIHKYGCGHREDIAVTYAELTNDDMAKFSDFAIRYHQIHEGEEYFFIWENISDEKPSLLYVRNVTADSKLTAIWEAMDLISRKF